MPSELAKALPSSPSTATRRTAPPEPRSLFLYKYLEYIHAITSITRDRIKVSKMDTLNDPYEMLPCLVNDEGAYAPVELAEAFRLDIANRSSTIGFICLSERVDSPVLWSHYAGQHTGVAIEFEFPSDSAGLVKVDYADIRVTRRTSDATSATTSGDQSFFTKHYLELIRTKFSGWAYEAEYRFWVPIGDQSLEDGLHFKAIPRDSIRRVILGCKCPIPSSAMECLLHVAGFHGTSVVRASLNDRGFGMIIPPPSGS